MVLANVFKSNSSMDFGFNHLRNKMLAIRWTQPSDKWQQPTSTQSWLLANILFPWGDYITLLNDVGPQNRTMGCWELMPRSHQPFCQLPAMKLLRSMLRNRCWPTTFPTITAGEVNTGGARSGWCDQPLSLKLSLLVQLFEHPMVIFRGPTKRKLHGE